MASHHENQEPLVSGRHIYLHKNGQTIYYNPFTKTSYIITKEDAKAYTYYSTRLFVAVAVAYTITVFSDNPFLGFGIGGAIWGILSLLFYKIFLPKLAFLSNFTVPDKDSFIERMVKKTSSGKLVSASMISLILGFFIGTLAYISGYEKYILAFNLFFVAGTVIFSIICAYAAYLRFRREKSGEFPRE